MKTLIATTALTALLSATGWAEFAWPTELVPVKLNNRCIQVSWRDGRPFAQRSDVFMLLHIPREGDPGVDLAAELEARNAKIVQKADGSIEASVSYVSAAAATFNQEGSAGLTGRANPTGNTQMQQYQTELARDQRLAANQPLLRAEGFRYVADTEYIRAYVKVTNIGMRMSQPCMAQGDFVDWYGHDFASHSLPVPALSPGESTEMTFFSMIQKDEAHPNGVTKGDKYTCRVSFIDGNGRTVNSGFQKKQTADQAHAAARVKKTSKLDFKLDTFKIKSSTTKITPGNGNSGSVNY